MGECVEEKEISLMEWIKSSGINVEYFSWKIKVDRSYIYKWARGTHIPSIEVMKRIKKVTLGRIHSVVQLTND